MTTLKRLAILKRLAMGIMLCVIFNRCGISTNTWEFWVSLVCLALIAAIDELN